jgi:hypothetical protein
MLFFGKIDRRMPSWSRESHIDLYIFFSYIFKYFCIICAIQAEIKDSLLVGGINEKKLREARSFLSGKGI